MRNISFSMTTEAVRRREKTCTYDTTVNRIEFAYVSDGILEAFRRDRRSDREGTA
jgi:hypothetical protein